MNEPENLYFQTYKELAKYCYSLIKIQKDSIIARVDSDFEENFEKDDLHQGINYFCRDVSIFYQDIDNFILLSLKSGKLSDFRHQYTNYDEVLNYLITKKVKSITSIRSVQLKFLKT